MCTKILTRIKKCDFSEYPENSKFYKATNKKVHGKIKDQIEANPIFEFWRLKGNMYSFIK